MIFTERAVEFGLENDSQGRGIVCFDADRDGVIDLVISNNFADNIVFYRNDTNNDNHYLVIRLAGMAATIDEATKGRFTLGIGAGWFQREHEAYGWVFPPMKERQDRLQEAAELIRLLSRPPSRSLTRANTTAWTMRPLPRAVINSRIFPS